MTSATNPLDALLAELRALLMQEREALLSGSPERIAAVAQCKLALADRIEREAAICATLAPNAGTLLQLARYNRENGAICAAMRRHMMQAIDKLRRCEPHRSYRPDGSEHNPPAGHTLGAA
jgi:flagellar biosynthesis/type III secretory pathway chaperone